MFINGTRADDLAGTGLITKQRWAVPIWLSLLGILVTGLFRVAAVLVGWSLRHPVAASILATIAATYQQAGMLGLLILTTATLLTAAAWSWAWPASWDRVIIRPARGVWRWQTRYRRLWYPALHGSGLTITTPDRQVFVPSVTRVTSTPVVDTLHVRLLHGHTPADLSGKAEGLRHSFGAHRAVVAEIAPGRVQIRLYNRDPLTTIVPAITPGTADQVDLARLHVGMAETGDPYLLRMRGGHILISAATGAGKASAIWSPIRAMAPAIHAGLIRLNGIDPKRMELVFAPDLFHRLEAKSLAGMCGLLEDQVAGMQERQDVLSGVTRDHVPTLASPAHVTVIDELASLTAYCTDRDIKKRVEAALSLLLSQGRAVGYHVIAAVQDPRKDVIAFRDLFPVRIALRTTEASHADMILGEGALERGAATHLIPDTMPGTGYVHVEGAREPVRVRFSYVTDGDLRDMNDRYPAPRPGATARVIDLRDHTTGSAGSGESGGRIPEPRNTPAPERTDGGELA